MSAPKRNHGAIDRIIASIEALDLTNLPTWSDLGALSTHTHVDAIEADPEGIWVSGKSFHGVASVYVFLEYGGNGEEEFTATDAFRAKFSGHFDDSGAAIIDDFNVDTSAFFAGEEMA